MPQQQAGSVARSMLRAAAVVGALCMGAGAVEPHSAKVSPTELSRRCTMCEHLAEALDIAIHRSMASNKTVETGWRLRDDGTREVTTMPEWKSDSGFAELAEIVCSADALGDYGLAPMKPYRGEPQWQLVHKNARRFFGQDTEMRGYARLLPPKPVDVPEGMELKVDILRDYRQACLALMNEHEEAVITVIRDGMVRTQKGDLWQSTPETYEVKRSLCTKQMAVCPAQMNRRWQAPHLVVEHYNIHAKAVEKASLSSGDEDPPAKREL